MGAKLIVIDGNSLINRAYFAMQRPMITKDGIYTQGIYGFLNMLLRLIEEYEPAYMAVAWDRKTPTFRHEAFDGYKAGRRKMPPELAMELPIMKDLLTAMGIRNLELDRYEADDIIGTVARMGEAAGLEPLIVTGDKDALQLCTDVTKVMITRRGISSFDLYDRSKMLERYELTPEQFIDLKGLMGDASDKLPGIPGVGEKTGIRLLKEFGSVSELLKRSDEIKSAKLREKVQDNAQLAVMSRKLAEIVTSAPLDITVEDLKRAPQDDEAVIGILSRLQFTSFLKRMRLSGGEPDAKEGGNSAFEREWKEVVIGASDPLDPLKEIPAGAETGLLVLGSDGHAEDPVLYAVLLLAPAMGTCFLVTGPEERSEELIGVLEEKKLKFFGSGLQQAYYLLMRKGLQTAETLYDCSVAAYCLAPTRSDYSLKVLGLELLKRELPEEGDLAQKAAQGSLLSEIDRELLTGGRQLLLACMDIWPLQEAQLRAQEEEQLAREIEFPLIEVLAAMECAGVQTDRRVLQQISADLTGAVASLEQEIWDLAGTQFNINSPIQLGEVLFERLGLPPKKKTKRGYSTSADVLESLKDKHPIVGKVLEYRTVAKLKSTYADGLEPLIGSDGRIRAHFQQTVTATGRLSCTAPNLQNIPVRMELGRTIRKAFIAGTGRTFVGADYSQIELRVLASMSGDENLIRDFREGKDIHRTTAARVFEVPYEEVTPLLRSRAKAVNFGVIYGMSGFGLSGEIHVSRKEAERYIQEYFAKHPQVRSFMDDAVKQAKEKGYSTTLFGRRRAISEIQSSNFMTRNLGERLAMNSPIQGTAADIIKIAMVRVYRELRDRGLRSRLVLQIHDELIIQTEDGELDTVKELLRRNMEEAADLKVAMVCDMNQADSWYDLK